MSESRKPSRPGSESKPLRILIVSSLCRESGSQLRARYIGEALSAAGARVRQATGVTSLPFGLNYLVSLVTNLRLVFVPTDVVIGFKPLPNITLLMTVKKCLGALTVIDVDDMDSGFRTGWIARLNHFLQRPFPKRFDLTTYHTDQLKHYISETFGVAPNRFYQLPQGVDTNLYSHSGDRRTRNKLISRYGLRGKTILVYTGHLNIASDLEEIFHIAKIASCQIPNLRLLVAGGGPMENHFRRAATKIGVDRITVFSGYLSPEQVVQHLQLADVGIVYYKETEANLYRESMKLREMLSLGLKTVGNDYGDLKRFSDFFYQTSSKHTAVANELIRLVDTGGDGREGRGSNFVRTHFEWRTIGKAFLEKLTSMTDKHVTSLNQIHRPLGDEKKAEGPWRSLT